MNVQSNETGKVVVLVKTGKKRVLVRFNDGQELLLSHDAYLENPLYEGKALDEDAYKSLVILAQEDKFYNAALKYVLKEAHTKHEVTQFLYKKGADEKTTYRILHRLEEGHFLDDRLYANIYARDAATVKLLGRNRVLANLNEKGISDDIIKDIEFDEENELAKARKYAFMANKKYASSANMKKMYKVISALLRRGFDEEIAKEAARLEFSAGDPELEMERLRKEAVRVKSRFIKRYSGYELNRRVRAALVRKGYSYENVETVMKEMENENIGNE